MDKALPSNIEAERAVLGSVLLNRDAIVAIAAWLQPDDFYHQQHAWVYEAMLTCYNNRVPPDTRTVSDELRRHERLEPIGGLPFLLTLVDTVPSSYHIEYYAQIVQRTALLRKLIGAGGKIAQIGYDESEDVEATLDKAESTLFEVSQRRSTQDFVHIGQVIDTYYEQINYLQEHRGEVVGVPTGFRDFDEITGGLQRSDLVILAARPAVGKTSFAMSIAHGVASHGNGVVGVFSLEMSRDQLVQRLIAMETGIDTHKLRTGHIRDSELQTVMEAMSRLASMPIYIEDSAGMSIMEVRSKARRLQSRVGIDLLVIDYLQLMQGRGRENRVQEVGEISRGLKALARELNVPVIALSQLSRAVEGRTSHVPMLSDLRESGCITGDSLVYLPDSGTYKRIDQLVGQKGFNVLALNPETWQLEPRPVLNAFATGRKPVFKLTTRLGRSIRATANHKFLTIGDWKRLDALTLGERIALPRSLPGPNQPTMSDAELGLLGHLIGDGCVHLSVGKKHYAGIYYATSSPQLARDVQSLLLRLGINVVRTRRSQGAKGRDQYHVIVSGKHDIERFFQIVGSIGINKTAHQEAIAAHMHGRVTNTNRDVIPREIWRQYAVPAMQTAGLTSRSMQAALGNAYCGTGLYKQNVSRDRAVRLANIVGSSELRHLAQSDVYWDEIISIEPDGQEEVYDLTVEGLHNFVANNTIIHNSIEQDADIVLFIYREELYEPETDKKGIAEIHLAKHRNGPVGVVPMRFDASTTKFMDLSYRTPDGY